MRQRNHWAFIVNNDIAKDSLLKVLLNPDKDPVFKSLQNLRGALFSSLVLSDFLKEENIHGRHVVTGPGNQWLNTMSSGEQKRQLLEFIMQQKPEFLILDNPFDHLDIETRNALVVSFTEIAKEIPIIMLVTRRRDLLPFITHLVSYNASSGFKVRDIHSFEKLPQQKLFEDSIPLSEFAGTPYDGEFLIRLHDVSVSFYDRQVLKNINWEIRPGEFWQLKGPNGSGKTTILNMITGDSIKGYGQDLEIFGCKKGSGESIWDLKKRIGYFTPSMTLHYERRTTALQMIISGFFDSVGLYTKPSGIQTDIAKKWLKILGMTAQTNIIFGNLTLGQQRMVMIARAMVKHPDLLILDEPTTGLDDLSAQLFSALVNKIASESCTTILYVSHNEEPGLKPDHIFLLVPSDTGSEGSVINNAS